jgi:hypothetical protein
MPCVRGSAASAWRAGARKEHGGKAFTVDGMAVEMMHNPSTASRTILNPAVSNSSELTDIS